MSERKNIDRLFQEKFKDFEVMPSEEAWGNIEARLDEKKKRRILPFWWKLSGVAAVFLIGFLISKSIYDEGTTPVRPIVNENNANKNSDKNAIDSSKKDSEIFRKSSENAIADEANSLKSEPKTTEGTIKKNFGNSENEVATTSNKAGNTEATEKKERQKTTFSTKSAVADRKSKHHRSLKNNSDTTKDKNQQTELLSETPQHQVAQNSKKNTTPISQKREDLVQTDSKENSIREPQTLVDSKNINLDDLKGNSISKIATKEIEKKENDTATAINSVANNELEELLNEKESKQKKESKRSRWQLASNVAPVFLGSVSNGSPIDSTLSKNSKSYNTNVGFGIGVSYAVNDKLSIRTGLNKVNISYDTNDISFFRGIQAKTLANVQPTASSAMIHVESSVSQNSNMSPEAELLPFESSFVNKSSGSLKQEMGYLEMPVEMTYNLLDKKFGLKIIGGFSTLFLQDNSITIVSENRDTPLGEASNLNDVHFSTNLGLGLKYSFLKSFEFNVEPTLKYQLNTFNKNAGDFKPYLFGVYSGISYKF